MSDKALLRPIQSPEELNKLISEANADKHLVINPTHIAVKGEEIIGHMSIFSMPIVAPWFHSQKCEAADSVRLIQQAETFMRMNGHKYYLVTIADDSPFREHMEKMGFSNPMPTNLMRKDL